jgi:tetratricopeptide (TPR) repeat protein
MLSRICLLAGFCFFLAAGRALTDEQPRGLIRVGGQTTKVQPYRKKFALIVGIDYRSDDRPPANGPINALSNAENDARAVAEMLTTNYGYSTEDVTVLLGKEATKAKIENSFESAKSATNDDSFLFFFAGHGFPDTVTNRAYLIPIDAISGSDPPYNVTSALDIRGIADNLIGPHCPARHKLFVIDACYGGKIFHGGFNTVLAGSTSSPNEIPHGTTNAVFQEPALQVFTAGRGAVDDGPPGGHSPFTLALTQALRTLPAKDKQPLTASGLFNSVRYFLDLQPGRRAVEAQPQPLCRWLGQNQGEFHFFPSATGEFADDTDPEQTRKMLLAMVPSAFGNWWVDEAPWFMPSLRSRILHEQPKSRSTEDAIDLRVLKTVAGTIAAGWRDQPGDELIQMRLRHLNALLAPLAPRDLETRMRRVVRELTENESLLEVTDRHFLAVLQQKLNMYADAEATYLKTIDEYETRMEGDPQQLRPLYALCRADFGNFLLYAYHTGADPSADASSAIRRYEEAARSFEIAGKMFGPVAPIPFQLYALYQEAAALRSGGKYGLADDRIQKAQTKLREASVHGNTLLAAATWKNIAWHHMILWRFNGAKDYFEDANKILSTYDEAERPEICIDQFHIRHGLAMADRYLGDTRRALNKYRELTSDIQRHLREMATTKEERPNYAQLRTLLSVRLVNSLERLGDCNLFAEQPDYLEAADDYRRAIQACARLPEDLSPQTKAPLLCKRSIAILLGANDFDLETAVRIREDARQLAREGSIRLIDFYCDVGKSLEKWFAGSKQAESLSDLQAAIVKHRAHFTNLADRDDLEGMMFACRLLLEREISLYREAPKAPDTITAGAAHGDAPKPAAPPQGISRFAIERDAELMLELCRMTRPTGDPDDDTLRYLRPFYDATFQARLAVAPKHCKELIEVAWEANQGRDYMKLPTVEPLLVMYYSNGRCYLLLDIPSGTSQIHLLDEDYTIEQLRAACGGDKIPLPEPLRKALGALKQRRDLSVLWVVCHDPVQGLPNEHERNRHDVLKVVAEELLAKGRPSASGIGSLSVERGTDSTLPFSAQSEFPFDCKRALPDSIKVKAINDLIENTSQSPGAALATAPE